MTWDSLPEHLNTPEKWKGTDNDVWYMRWEILTKGWWAFSYRSSKWWSKWRKYPITLLKMGGNGPWRYELAENNEYLSRIQYWKRWHFQISWPFMIAFSCYWKEKDVPKHPNYPENLNISKFLYFYGPIHFDADQVFWIMSFFIGGTWK